MTLIGRHWLPLGPDLTAGTARYAGQNARAQPLRLHGLPGPLATYRNSSGREVQIVAVSWGPWHDPLDHPAADGLQLTFYSHPTPLFRRSAFTGGNRQPGRGSAPEPRPGHYPSLLPDNEVGWTFDRPRRGGEHRRDGRQLGTDRRRRLAADAPALTRETAEQANRAARRRLARVGESAPDIRREHAPRSAAGRGPARDHDHQWWVRAHWRTYWCGLPVGTVPKTAGSASTSSARTASPSATQNESEPGTADSRERTPHRAVTSPARAGGSQREPAGRPAQTTRPRTTLTPARGQRAQRPAFPRDRLTRHTGRKGIPDERAEAGIR